MCDRRARALPVSAPALRSFPASLLSCGRKMTMLRGHLQLNAAARIAILLLLARNAWAGIPAVAGLALPYRVHVFYYLWYGEPATDGAFQHWDHEVLAHWSPDTAKQHPHGMRFEPPHCLHAPFYPLRGPYSSRSQDLIRQHLHELWEYGIGVIVVSWWGPTWRAGSHDTQLINTDERVEQVIKEIEETKSKVRVAFHLEPYPGRTKETVAEDLKYLSAKYRHSAAIFRIGGKPLYYVYDSYRLPAGDWAALLRPNGAMSVRGTEDDGYFLGLFLEKEDGVKNLEPGGFDGAYTYFACETTSYSSNPDNWRAILDWALEHGMLFVASIGPGYNDSKIRPWNLASSRDREDGDRYRQLWKRVAELGVEVVSITSFNEWGEGTQIEPAVHQPSRHGCDYLDFEPGGPYLYMNLTKYGALEMAQRL